MQAADVYAQGNRWSEGFSLSFLEASYNGLPIVTTNLGGAPEMVDEATGILVPPNELGLFQEALRRMITEPVLRRAMGERARVKAVRLSDTRQQLERLEAYLVAR
jgi:glycosyltransferase involved in cell wall biosynthesis